MELMVLKSGSIEKAFNYIVAVVCGNESIRAITSPYSPAELNPILESSATLVESWHGNFRVAQCSSTLASRWTYPSHRSEFALN